jgi:hypothetical protein
VHVTSLTGARSLWDLPRVNYLVRAILGYGAAGQFLEGFKVFCLVLWSFFVSFSLILGGVFVPGPREVIEASWNFSMHLLLPQA